MSIGTWDEARGPEEVGIVEIVERLKFRAYLRVVNQTSGGRNDRCQGIDQVYFIAIVAVCSVHGRGAEPHDRAPREVARDAQYVRVIGTTGLRERGVQVCLILVCDRVPVSLSTMTHTHRNAHADKPIQRTNFTSGCDQTHLDLGIVPTRVSLVSLFSGRT